MIINKGIIYYSPIIDYTLDFITLVLKLCHTLDHLGKFENSWRKIIIIIIKKKKKIPEGQVLPHTNEIKISMNGNQVEVFFENHYFILPHSLYTSLK